MDLLFDYIQFLIKTGTIVVAVIIVIMFISANAVRRSADKNTTGHLSVKFMNEFYQSMGSTIEEASMTPDQLKKQRKIEKNQKKKSKASKKKSSPKAPVVTEEKVTAEESTEYSSENAKEAEEDKKSKPAFASLDHEEGEDRSNVYVVAFKGDVEASTVDQLTHSISAVLTQATPEDEVVVRVESPGGVVHSYGHAASQLMRVRNAGVKLTVAVDEVAASGGYMMAVVANKIIAAPFALVGSIGVAAEIPNVNRLLKKHDIDYEIITAGEFKRTLSVFGENTDAARQKFSQEIHDVHTLFKDFVIQHRSDVDVDVVATGESWYGQRAIDLNLIDEIQTSDEYIMKSCQTSNVYEVTWHPKKKNVSDVLSQVVSSITAFTQWIRRGIH